MREKKSHALLIVLIIYLVSITIGILFMLRSGISSLLINAMAGDIVVTLLVFAASLLFNNSSMYDPYWSVIPPLLAVYWIWMIPAPLTPPLILLLLVMFYWGIRLTVNWVRDWHGMDHEDWRYANFRRNFGRFYWLVSLGGIHLFPTVIVFICMIPVYLAILKGGATLNIYHLIGFIVAMAGTTLELISDEQMKIFKQKTENKGKIIETGLWKYSRHPNYLGEVMFWFGMWFFCIGAGSEFMWTLAAPVSMLLMFMFVSIPLMERKIIKTRPEYKIYRQKTSMLILLRRRLF